VCKILLFMIVIVLLRTYWGCSVVDIYCISVVSVVPVCGPNRFFFSKIWFGLKTQNVGMSSQSRLLSIKKCSR
jgi:hypothetical protein